MSKKKPPGNKEINEDPVLTDKASIDPVPADKAPVKNDQAGISAKQEPRAVC
jgi:hypothetical protein